MHRVVLLVVGLLVALSGAAPAGGTFERGTFEGRAYRVWVPGRVEPARPVVVALHGCWQTPEDFALGPWLGALGFIGLIVYLYRWMLQRSGATR